MSMLAPGLDYIDLNFLGSPGIIATGIVQGADGIALVDPGPSTTLPTLKKSIETRGFSVRDVRAILLTHIHLDHAGSSGSLVPDCPGAMVYVHQRGAPHLIDPSKLVASASRLYGADMERLWGDIRPVPADRIRVLETGQTTDPPLRLHIVGHDLEVAWTPGHAWHHVSYFLPSARLAFVGDTAGICRPSGRVVLPPTPPPDIDLEAWRVSTQRILAWDPDLLFLTHFGPQPSPRLHFHDMWTRMDLWSRRTQALLERPGTDDERARIFMDEVTDELQRATNRQEAEAYARAGRFDFSWAGLARYWRAKSKTPDSSKP
jgi:glyoxylase-like metal-dependent hydrolase (beta-lactamase superfamily II)